MSEDWVVSYCVIYTGSCNKVLLSPLSKLKKPYPAMDVLWVVIDDDMNYNDCKSVILWGFAFGLLIVSEFVSNECSKILLNIYLYWKRFIVKCTDPKLFTWFRNKAIQGKGPIIYVCIFFFFISTPRIKNKHYYATMVWSRIRPVHNYID